MILVAGGIKGGSGKTTVATNLAIMRALQGCDVLLIDADDQETATDFTTLRNERRADGAGYTSIKLTGPAVRTETLRLAAKYDDIVIDTGGRDTSSQRAALTVADVLLVPFVPRSFDVWTLEKVAALVAEMQTVNPKLTALTFLNRADPRGHDNVEAQEVLKETHALQDTVGEPPSAEKYASHMPSLKAQEQGESEVATAALSRGNRFANSIGTFCETTIISSCMHDVSLAPQRSRGTGHELGVRSVAASLLVWGAAPGMACGWGVTSPSRVAQACVNSAPKNMIRAE